MPVRFPCPACAKEMLLEKVHEGFEVPCPACGALFPVPVGAADAADAAPPPPPEPRAPTRGLPPELPPLPPAPPPPPQSHDPGGDGSVVLVLGLVSVAVLPLLGPAAWIMGHRMRRAARAEGREPSQHVTVGWALGIVGTVMLLVAGCILTLVVAAFTASRP